MKSQARLNTSSKIETFKLGLQISSAWIENFTRSIGINYFSIVGPLGMVAGKVTVWAIVHTSLERPSVAQRSLPCLKRCRAENRSVFCLPPLCFTILVILLGWHRPISGLWPEMEKRAEKWILGPPKKWEKKGQKMGKSVENLVFDPFLSNFSSHSSAIFLPFPWWAQNPFFGYFFCHFGPEARNGSVPAQRDHNTIRADPLPLFP